MFWSPFDSCRPRIALEPVDSTLRRKAALAHVALHMRSHACSAIHASRSARSSSRHISRESTMASADCSRASSAAIRSSSSRRSTAANATVCGAAMRPRISAKGRLNCAGFARMRFTGTPVFSGFSAIVATTNACDPSAHRGDLEGLTCDDLLGKLAHERVAAAEQDRKRSDPPTSNASHCGINVPARVCRLPL